MKDLEILESEKNYREFLAHALDIRPGQRGRSWETMTQQMAEGFISELIKQKQFDHKHLSYLSSLGQWPALKKSEFFHRYFLNYAQKYLQNCFESQKGQDKNEQCLKDLHLFWNRWPKDPETGVVLGKLLATHRPEVSLWPFFSPMATHELSEFYCQHPLLRKTILSRVFSLIEKEGPSHKIRIHIHKSAHPDCWKKIIPFLKASADKKMSPRQRESLYILLTHLTKMNQSEKDLFLTRYFLAGPPAGATLNQAWNNMVALGQNHLRRQALMAALRSLDPLPDKIFGHLNPHKGRVFFKFFHSHFPEYIDHYGKTCYNYLIGKGYFPNGNPTIHCREFTKALSVTESLTPLQRKLQAAFLNQSGR